MSFLSAFTTHQMSESNQSAACLSLTASVGNCRTPEQRGCHAGSWGERGAHRVRAKQTESQGELKMMTLGSPRLNLEIHYFFRALSVFQAFITPSMGCMLIGNEWELASPP